MSRSKRKPNQEEIAAAERDPRFCEALSAAHTDPEWRLRGRCLSVDPETFFPEPSAQQTPTAALALCSGCRVQASCLAWALDAGDRNGVWGGTTPRERQAMILAWKNTVPAA